MNKGLRYYWFVEKVNLIWTSHLVFGSRENSLKAWMRFVSVVWFRIDLRMRLKDYRISIWWRTKNSNEVDKMQMSLVFLLCDSFLTSKLLIPGHLPLHQHFDRVLFAKHPVSNLWWFLVVTCGDRKWQLCWQEESKNTKTWIGNDKRRS